MTNESILKILVELYRIAGKPAITDSNCQLLINYSSDAHYFIKKLAEVQNLNQYIEDDDFIIDNNIKDARVPEQWDEVSLSIKLPRDSIYRFHNSIAELITFPSLRNGEFPSEIYIVDLDYFSGDSVKPQSIINLEKICSLIKSLGKLAHYHDNKSSSIEPRLVFIQGSEDRSKATVLQPVITEDMVGIDDLNCNFVEQLQDEISLEDINHHTEKRGIFRNTIVEFTSDNNLDFTGLIEKWKDFHLAYDNNLSVYLSGFSFHKARKDVALAELDFAEKTSKSISELTTKLLSIPISLLAALGIWNLKGITEQSVVLAGVIFTSIIVNLIITSQHKQFLRVIHSKNMVFNPFKSKLADYPHDLKKDIGTIINELKRNERFTLRVIFFFYALCWMPVITSIGIIFFKYHNP